MNLLKKLFNAFIILIIPIIIIFSLTLFFAYNNGVYVEKFNEYELDKAVGITMDEMEEVSQELIEFIKGKRPNLENVYVNYKGEEVSFFNQREMDHMDDVVILFKYVNVIRNTLLIVLLIYILVCWNHRKSRKQSLLVLGLGGIFTILTTVAIIALSYLDFSKYFTYFHELLFTNDLWLLDPKTDMLIRMLPLEMFIDIVTKIVIGSIVVSIVVIIVSFVIRSKIKNKGQEA